MKRMIYDATDKAEATRTLQKCLLELSRVIPNLPPHPSDGVFSETTRDDVLIFQSYAGLPETGVADAATWGALKRAYDDAVKKRECEETGLPFPMTLPLAVGSRGTPVYLIQSVIGDLTEYYRSVPAPNVTGRYGTSTAYAVGLLQRRYGLRETGVTDAATWRRILSDYTARLRLSETLDV